MVLERVLVPIQAPSLTLALTLKTELEDLP
jgi:hypothetical protein